MIIKIVMGTAATMLLCLWMLAVAWLMMVALENESWRWGLLCLFVFSVPCGLMVAFLD